MCWELGARVEFEVCDGLGSSFDRRLCGVQLEG
jgi:hypothetical protein